MDDVKFPQIDDNPHTDIHSWKERLQGIFVVTVTVAQYFSQYSFEATSFLLLCMQIWTNID